MIEVQNLSKHYGAKKAVDNISFRVGAREILGFLGPNGAGKSTTMNIIAGYASPSSGAVRINGLDMLEAPSECKRHIGYLPERPPLYADMTAKEYLSFMFDLKKVALPKKTHLAEVCDATGIDGIQERLIKNLSKGYQQRVGLAQAMLGNPAVLILDEPTVGLDPKQILDVRALVKTLGERCAVIFSSHILQEIQAVCGRVIVINNGALVADDTTASLTQGDSRVLVRVAGGEAAIYEALSSLPAVKTAEKLGEKEAGAYEFALEPRGDADIRRDVFFRLAERGLPLLAMGRRDTSLEDMFLRLVAGERAAQEEGA